MSAVVASVCVTVRLWKLAAVVYSINIYFMKCTHYTDTWNSVLYGVQYTVHMFMSHLLPN